MKDCNMSKMQKEMKTDEKKMDMKLDNMEVIPMNHMHPMCQMGMMG